MEARPSAAHPVRIAFLAPMTIRVRSSRSRSARPAAGISRRRCALRRPAPGRRLRARSAGAPAFPRTRKRSAARRRGYGSREEGAAWRRGHVRAVRSRSLSPCLGADRCRCRQQRRHFKGDVLMGTTSDTWLDKAIGADAARMPCDSACSVPRKRGPAGVAVPISERLELVGAERHSKAHLSRGGRSATRVDATVAATGAKKVVKRRAQPVSMVSC
jgi:hypothetical protein